MKSKLRLAEIALTALAAAHMAGCGSGSSNSGTGGATGGGGSGTAGSGAGGKTDAGVDAPATDSGPSDASGAVDTNGDALPGPCVQPAGTSPSGTAPLQVAGPAVAATATRPQFDQPTADANYTIAKFISNGGSVVSTYVTNGMTVTSANVVLPDGWDPVTNGIGDVSTFTPMYTVSADGTGTHTTVAAAITAARLLSNTTCARVYILVKPGIYRGTATVSNKTSAPAITLYPSTDSDATHTVIVFNNASLTVVAGAALGTSGSATFTNSSSNFQAKNLTFSNDYVETGSGNEQAVALLNQGDRSQFENVRVLGNQDTLYVKTVNTGTIARLLPRFVRRGRHRLHLRPRHHRVRSLRDPHDGQQQDVGHGDRRAQHRGHQPLRVPVHQQQVHGRRQRRRRQHLPGAAVV